VGKFLNIVVLAVVMRRCGNSKNSNYRQNFLATLLHNGKSIADGGALMHYRTIKAQKLNSSANYLIVFVCPTIGNTMLWAGI
jgi:hypothetical protein